MTIIRLKKCLRSSCLHKWYPKRPGDPKVCPKCKSPYWNTKKGINNG